MIALDDRRLITAAECAPVVDAARNANAIHLPVILAGVCGQIDVTFLTRPAVVMPAHLSTFSRPHLVIIGDDPIGYGGRVSVGPSGWRCAPRLQYLRPHVCYVHGSGGHASDYAAAVEVTRNLGRMLMVECSSVQAPAWAKLTERFCPTVAQGPVDGVHPVAETVH